MSAACTLSVDDASHAEAAQAKLFRRFGFESVVIWVEEFIAMIAKYPPLARFAHPTK
jgi:hypothetical protein